MCTAMNDQQVLFGKIALELGYATPDKIESCARLQEREGSFVPLGRLLVRENILTTEQRDEILRIQDARLQQIDPRFRQKRADSLFGRLCVERGFLSVEELNECLRKQATLEREGHGRKLGELLLESGKMTSTQIQTVLELQARTCVRCSGCGAVYNVSALAPRTRFQCASCPALLDVPEKFPIDFAQGKPGGQTPPAVMIVAATGNVAEHFEASEEALRILAVTKREFVCPICRYRFEELVSPERSPVRCTRCGATFRPSTVF